MSVWTTVHIRNCPWRDGSTMTLPAQTLNSVCQATGETVTDPVYGSNNWWTYVILGENSGWISNIYLRGDAHLNNVPDCASITQH
ncbi:hypothetical protein [Streptomyces rubellomurinus]|uniref:hypothetical protein n=1 Tax=Streptomyces rubellomurinus (strain ATCC 31215) TaxID=359131 RepID=UPI000696CF2E|nr:hypothetical protein [Streptomyces rubellomurinus]